MHGFQIAGVVGLESRDGLLLRRLERTAQEQRPALSVDRLCQLACHVRAVRCRLVPTAIDPLTSASMPDGVLSLVGAWPYNRPCAQQYVGKSQSCMVISGRLIVHAPVQPHFGPLLREERGQERTETGV